MDFGDKKCPNCRSGVSDGMKFCPSCGQRLSRGETKKKISFDFLESDVVYD